jgi:hypothetical protein
MRTMPILAALALAAAALPAMAGGPHTSSTAPMVVPNLRQVLQQYHPGTTPPPRQLSPEERAELRRQLSESSAPKRRHP